jgi:predicted GH43/DUF377 family glycosyl hydrolase
MKWIKRGRIFDPSRGLGWLTHAQGPTVLVRDECLRIYFASRPEPNLSLPAYIDVDIDEPKTVVAVCEGPLLALGERGSFDEFGLIPCEVIENKGEIWLYYTGWSRGTTVSYTLSIGLAVSRDGGKTFKKAFAGPVLDRTKHEPFMTMAPFIRREAQRWHMWYASGIGFYETQGKHEPRYIIKYATSTNGVDWQQPNLTCIVPRIELESNTRPTVIKIGDVYHMWFAYRGAEDFRGGRNSYRIGYATSRDLLKWERNDEAAGITVSQEGWDSEIVTYPYVARVKDRWLMFYNGNGFGATGFGYAAASWE